MQQGIVIVTHPKHKKFLRNLLRSLDAYSEYPTYIVVNDWRSGDLHYQLFLDELTNYPEIDVIHNIEDGYECGAIQMVLDQTDLDEFFLLQDTWEINDPVYLFDLAFNIHKGACVTIHPRGQCYAVKFCREVLQQMEIPKTRTKERAIYHEAHFVKDYLKLDTPHHTVCPDWGNVDERKQLKEEKFGRLNLVISNDIVTKYKGTWQHNLQDRINAIDKHGVI